MKIYTLEELELASEVFLERVQIYNPLQASIYQNQINLGCRFNDVMKLEKWSIVNELTVSLLPQKNNSLRVFNYYKNCFKIASLWQRKLNRLFYR